MGGLTKKAKLIMMVCQGFSYRLAKEYLAFAGSGGSRQAREVMRLLPFQVTFDKMFEDMLTTRRVLWGEREYFPPLYAMAAIRDGRRTIHTMEDADTRQTLDDDGLEELLRRTGGLDVRTSYHFLRGKLHRLRVAEDKVLLDGAEQSGDALRSFFAAIKEDTLLTGGMEAAPEAVERYGCSCPVVHIRLLNREGTHRVVECFVSEHAAPDGSWLLYSKDRRAADEGDPQIAAAAAIARHIGGKFADAPYLNVGVLLSDRGPLVWQIDTGKDLAVCPGQSDELRQFLLKAQERKKRDSWAIPRLAKYAFSAYAQRKGFVDYMYRNWLRGLRDDNRVACTTREEKRWAHKRGFYSYRIRQYGLTEENYRDVLSDYAYKRLRPINGKYQKWLWDKVFMYYVMEPYLRYLPRHDFHIVPGEEGTRIYTFDPDDPAPVGPEAVADRLREAGTLAAKPDIGSHGKGFFKLAAEEGTGKLSVNGEAYSEEAFRQLLLTLDKPYLVSEYIRMHDDLRRIYDRVVGTVRLMVIDMGEGPAVRSAFFRVGSGGTGNTDNLDSGGIVARVDVDTGVFSRAEILADHVYRPLEVHPDSGVPLNGVLPHWETIKAAVCEIAAYLYPLEYLGFDIVITQDGFRILEINTHQDLHRYPEYSQEVKDYFARKQALRGRTNYVQKN